MIHALDIRPVTLTGQRTGLRPLTLADVSALAAVGLEPELWRLTTSRIETEADMRLYVETALAEASRGVSLPFVILDRKGGGEGTVVGSTRFGAIDRKNRRLEIGWTWIASAWQRTHINTEAKLLLLTHAFEQLGCLRVEFKTDSLNEKSKAALKRIGAIEEGTFRNHMVTPSGRIRHSVYFSIIREEWPETKAQLQARLSS